MTGAPIPECIPEAPDCPTLDPDASNIASCGLEGLYVPGGAVGWTAAASVVYVPGSPPATGQIASGTAVVTNPNTTDALLFATFTLQANTNVHGTAKTDVILSAQFDGGGYGNIVQDLHSLEGMISADPTIGGDGTLSPFGRNAFHKDVTSGAQTRISGGFDGMIPALVTPGAHSIDFSLDLIFGGLWDDPANPGDCFAFWIGFVSWVLVPT